jgi:tetratricopeptide (TPR) repeat protein
LFVNTVGGFKWEINMISKDKALNTFLCGTLAVILSIAIIAIIAIGKKARDNRDSNIDNGYVGTATSQEKINQLITVLATNPNDSSVLVGLGEAYFNMKNYEEAIKFFLRAEKLRPNDTNVKNKLGAFYSRQGNSDLAISKFQAAYDADPCMLFNLYSIAQIYMIEKHDNQSAEVFLKRILSNNPDNKLLKAVKRDLETIALNR